MIAMALSVSPKLVIADEPISALDALSQKLVIDLLFELQRRHGFSMLYVTHDLRIASRFDFIGVLKSGRIVEIGSAEEILMTPKASYTQDLLAAAKDLSVS
jgi:peptide/nickel transport system ATP-binding protein